MSGLTSYVEKRALVITHDGRTIVGTLMGFDQTTNIILSDAIERIYSMEDGVEEQPLGLYIIRGDNIALIGEMDVAAEKSVDWANIKAEPIPEITFA